MADSQRPGGPPELSRLLEDIFEVPERPSIGRDEAQHRVVSKVREAGMRGERIFLSDQLVRRGALFAASGARVVFPEGDAYERSFVALVDPTPEARWGHPAFFVFVPAEGKAETKMLETLLPEHPESSVRLLPLPPSTPPT